VNGPRATRAWPARSAGHMREQGPRACAGRARAQRGPVSVFKPKTSVASFRLVILYHLLTERFLTVLCSVNSGTAFTNIESVVSDARVIHGHDVQQRGVQCQVYKYRMAQKIGTFFVRPNLIKY